MQHVAIRDKDATAANGGSGAPGSLPEWDLSDLYPGPDSEPLKRDLAALEESARDFAKRYKGKIADLPGKEFGEAIAAYEKLVEVLYRILSYGQLLHSGNVSDAAIGRFYQGLNEKGTAISTETLFFTLEINRLSDEALADKMKAPQAAHYAPWVRDVRLFKDHQLSDELEQLMHEKEITGASAWVRLFDETMAAMRFPVDGQDLTITEVTHRLSDKDPARRQAAAKALGAGLGEKMPLFSLITNTLAKDKEIEDKWRRYPHPMAARNLANQVEDEVVQALVGAVKDRFPTLSHRYYRMKAKWFGVDKLNYWDRNAPLPEDEDKTYSWDEAVDLVMGAYGRFAPKLADVAQDFFRNNWIDVPPRAGKASGAFAHPTVPSAHPYLLLNFMGQSRDVMTLAHELGHGCHQVLAGQQGTLMSNTPLTLAETASVFGEMLTFRAMVDAEQDPVRRRVLLAGKVEDMLNTVVRQIAFHEFERHVHAERRDGELSAERLGEIWMQVQHESLGDAFRYDDEYRHYWAYIPHFIHTPFYVYAYAFGDCLVNSLYRVYETGEEGFQDKYLDMLRAGGTLRHRELLEPFGLDASDPAFWKKGISVIEGFIDELEQTQP